MIQGSNFKLLWLDSGFQITRTVKIKLQMLCKIQRHSRQLKIIFQVLKHTLNIIPKYPHDLACWSDLKL